MTPKRNAPTGRNARVKKRVRVTAVTLVPNSLAMSLITNTRMKKSKASKVHPRKHAMTVLRCLDVRVLSCSRTFIVAGYFRRVKSNIKSQPSCCKDVLFSEVFDLKPTCELYAQSGLRKLGHLSYLRNNERVIALPRRGGRSQPGRFNPG